MRFYGLLDHDLDEVIEFYPSREAAEKELDEILLDEPGWVEKLEIVLVDFSGDEAAVTRVPCPWGTGPPARRAVATGSQTPVARLVAGPRTC